MRRMAWIALIHGLAASFYLTESALMYTLMFDGAVVGAYMGFSTARDGWGSK